MPKKFMSCVKKLKKKYKNPYGICRVSTGFYGQTHRRRKK